MDCWLLEVGVFLSVLVLPCVVGSLIVLGAVSLSIIRKDYNNGLVLFGTLAISLFLWTLDCFQLVREFCPMPTRIDGWAHPYFTALIAGSFWLLSIGLIAMLLMRKLGLRAFSSLCYLGMPLQLLAIHFLLDFSRVPILAL